MKITLTVLMVLILMNLSVVSFADDTASIQDKEYGWWQNEKPVSDSDNIKTKYKGRISPLSRHSIATLIESKVVPF